MASKILSCTDKNTTEKPTLFIDAVPSWIPVSITMRHILTADFTLPIAFLASCCCPSDISTVRCSRCKLKSAHDFLQVTNKPLCHSAHVFNQIGRSIHPRSSMDICKLCETFEFQCSALFDSTKIVVDNTNQCEVRMAYSLIRKHRALITGNGNSIWVFLHLMRP